MKIMVILLALFLITGCATDQVVSNHEYTSLGEMMEDLLFEAEAPAPQVEVSQTRFRH